MAENCDPVALMEASKCFQCVGGGIMAEAIAVAVLVEWAQIAPSSLNPYIEEEGGSSAIGGEGGGFIAPE